MTDVPAVRVLRWVFSRAGETMYCELSLDSHAFAYQLRVSHYDNRGPFTEQFRDVAKAFDRQCQLESSLLRDGWTLDSYQSS
jgi:hypothetical protein